MMSRLLRLYCLLCILCTACTTHEAPIVNGWKQDNATTSDYRVQPGDTIYSIALAFDIDYRELAQANHLQEPYHLSKNEVLHLPSSKSQAAKPAVHAKTIRLTAEPQLAVATAKTTQSTTKTVSQTIQGNWIWPTQGKVAQGFSNTSGGNKGINISGNLGQPIVAAATGKVVYTGASLPGYGNLIIIKHNDNQLSAYAFNKVIAVKEGQVVKAGQMIAKMGIDDAAKPMLHFEIRENGKPVDPMLYFKEA